MKTGPDPMAPLAHRILRLRNDNLVPRPWGGLRLRAFKQLPDRGQTSRFGESFEVAACPGDPEAAAYPSRVLGPDGAQPLLQDLLAAHGSAILGRAATTVEQPSLMLLPKFLDVESLLSVQAHPPGNPECYVILDADPGATLRLGFRRDVTAADLIDACRRGRDEQQALLDLCGERVSPEALHATLAPLLAQRGQCGDTLAGAIADWLPQQRGSAAATQLLGSLHARYWGMLDLLNEIPLRSGQVIFNATPPRLRGAGPAHAEVHALGDPEEHETLLLEIRRPGVTWRAWDHGRFPLRALDIERAVGALNLAATRPEEFIAGQLTETALGTMRPLIACQAFSALHLTPDTDRDLSLDTEHFPVTLHGIAGRVRISSGDDTVLIGRGESALLPAALGECRFRAETPGGQLIAVRVYS
jgi:mannose-6-phosphate isomerase class I